MVSSSKQEVVIQEKTILKLLPGLSVDLFFYKLFKSIFPDIRVVSHLFDEEQL